MPRVEDIFWKVNGAKYLSALNLHAGYHHIPLEEDYVPKTAYTCPFGKYEYLKVPFGWAQAPAYFQELMNKVLKDLPFTIAYLDDIIIYCKSAKDHLDHLQQVFHKLHHIKLTMKLSKCHFFSKEIQYLGHFLSNTGIKLLSSKTAASKLMNPHKTAKEVSISGTCWLLPQVHQEFYLHSKATDSLTWHDAKFTWTSSHLTAFNTLKSALLEAPILHHPDPSKCYKYI